MPRGGARQGKPGQAYQNRSDLNAPKLPGGNNRPAPGQTYGKGAAQQAALKAVPIQTPSAPAPVGGPDPMQAAQDWQPVPGSPAQTARPGEPVTSGLSTGPGAGPEALTAMGAPTDPDLERLLPYMPYFEILASNPDATASTRVFYRRLLAAQMGARMGGAQ